MVSEVPGSTRSVPAGRESVAAGDEPGWPVASGRQRSGPDPTNLARHAPGVPAAADCCLPMKSTAAVGTGSPLTLWWRCSTDRFHP